MSFYGNPNSDKPGLYPSGTYPAGSFPAGTYPSGSFPAGSFPSGSFPSGTYATSQYPPGSQQLVTGPGGTPQRYATVTQSYMPMATSPSVYTTPAGYAAALQSQYGAVTRPGGGAFSTLQYSSVPTMSAPAGYTASQLQNAGYTAAQLGASSPYQTAGGMSSVSGSPMYPGLAGYSTGVPPRGYATMGYPNPSQLGSSATFPSGSPYGPPY